MDISIHTFREQDLEVMIRIWNGIVEEGVAFPQMHGLDMETGRSFFGRQTSCRVAEDMATGKVLGLYILHPNNEGRCGHISNASYAVRPDARGAHVGEALVRDCLAQAKAEGFRILQFNAVVRTNAGARHLYEKLGFTPLGTIPGGFLMKDGHYEDIIPYYRVL